MGGPLLLCWWSLRRSRFLFLSCLHSSSWNESKSHKDVSTDIPQVVLKDRDSRNKDRELKRRNVFYFKQEELNLFLQTQFSNNCYFKQESAAIIEKQSRTIQELRHQLELNRQLELSRHLELHRQIDLLAGRLATIETNQKQHYEHELRLQSPETQPKQHLPTNNQPQHIKINAKRPNFYLKTKNRFSTLKDEMGGNALKNEMGNNINSTKHHPRIKKLSLSGGLTSIKFSAAPKYDFPKQST
ncbi:hypothetical protein FHG87_023773 [Trinorchestia longiramus]|nr:hypothetical protein FHG87_023773 [Trinorchestia longiramus]